MAVGTGFSRAGRRSEAQRRDRAPQHYQAGDVGEINGVYIQQAAAMVGASPSALRMWERSRLVQPSRTASGYRVYTLADVERLREVQQLLEQGVNLTGVRRLLDDAVAVAPVKREGGPRGVHSVGHKLHSLRVRHEMTLRQVGDLTGLSPSYISAVERCIASPSIASLQKLATAFGTNVLALLGDPNSAPETPVTRAGQRPLLESQHGVTIEDCSTAGSNLEPLVFTIDPGSGSDGPLSHEGEEFLYLTQGELRLRLDGTDDYDLGPGDSMAYNSLRPHQFTNHGGIPTVVIWVNTPRTF